MPTFTNDYVTWHLPVWRRVLAPLRDRPAAVLEIGSMEGRSALFFLDFLPYATVTCVDVFHPIDATTLPYEARFDTNVAPFGSRVEKRKGWSTAVLPALRAEGRHFDVVYVDGGHARDIVFADTTLAWPMLVPGGILMWDDYQWEPARPAAERPQEAIDAFLALHDAELTVLHMAYQVIVQRRATPEPAGAASTQPAA